MSELTKDLKNIKTTIVQEQMAFQATFLGFLEKIGIFVIAISKL